LGLQVANGLGSDGELLPGLEHELCLSCNEGWPGVTPNIGAPPWS
jgi:hypothetical protein